MNKFKIWWLPAMLLIVPTLYAGVVDRIVAVVNDEVITLSELNAAFEPYRKRIEDTYKGAGRETVLAESRMAFLKRLIDTSLIEQESKKNSIFVNDEEVMMTIRDIISRKNLTLEDLTRELAKDGLSMAAYKKDIREQLIRMRLIRREVKAKLMVTDQEIGEYYRLHRSDYEGKEAVRLKQIFLAFPRGAERDGKEKIRKDAENIMARLKNGESFDLLEANLSMGASRGSGELGFIEKGTVLPEVENVAYALNKGEVSDLIESPVGYHIIKVVDKRGGGLKPIAEVREEIQGKIEDQKMGKKFDEWLETLRKKSHIEVKL